MIINKFLRKLGLDVKPSKAEIQKAIKHGMVRFSKDILQGTYPRDYIDMYFLILCAKRLSDDEEREMLISIAEHTMTNMCKSQDLDSNLFGICGLKLLRSKRIRTYSDLISEKDGFVILFPPGSYDSQIMSPKEAVQFILNTDLPELTQDDWKLANIPVI